ncbi:oligosaccharide flippase family protein [Enterococcus sp. DIV0170]|uniref:oligosaccharide flippase family protein n=1 Tax=Enterococcus sp. DIV0170 TaxID=2774642 RepID=UPI003F29DDCF
MKRKLAVNFFYQASYQILLIILPIITIPIVSKALGPGGIGTYNYINSIVAYFVLVAGLGMANYGVREIAIVRDDRYNLSKKFWELEGFNVFISILTLIVYLIWCLIFSNTFYFLISSILIISNLFDITWFFSGMEDFKKITIRNFVIRISSFFLIVFFIRDKNDLDLYFVINLLSTLVSQLSLWISIKKYITWVKVTLKECFSHFKPLLSYFLAKVAVTLYQNATKTILGVMTTMTVVGYYSNSFSLVLMCGNVINAMNTVLIPRMSNLFENKDEEKMIGMIQRTIHFQLYFTIAIAFGIILLSSKLVDWFFGSNFSEIKNILPWLAPVVVTQSFQMSVATQYLIPKNEMKEYNISVLIGAVVTVVSTIIFVPFIGVYGAIIGINLGYLVVSILRLRMLLIDTTFKFEYKNVIKWIFSGVIMLIVGYIFTKKMSSSLLTTFVQIILGGFIYLCVTMLLNANPMVKMINKSKKIRK